MPSAAGIAPQRKFTQTSRTDHWWVSSTLVFLGFTAFIVYSTWAALQGVHYEYGNYLSPFYSPLLFGDSPHAWFGPNPSWYAFSPAFLILWVPGGFRFTCYYYRGAYYKAFWADPPACSVGEPRKTYLGERSFPLVIQNIHRYFLYLALVLIVILSIDAWKAMWFATPDGGTEFGIGVGTLVLTVNSILLAGYVFGCHSLRHLIGGRLNVFSKHPMQKKCWDCISAFNRKHMLWAWISLIWVGLSDAYVRLCSMGKIHDWRIF